MNFSKSVTVAFFIFSVFTSFSQKRSGFEIGLGISKIQFKYDADVNLSSVILPHLGWVIEEQLSENLFYVTGIQVQGKGGIATNNRVRNEVNTFYGTIPLKLGLKFNKFSVAAGGFFSLGLSGTSSENTGLNRSITFRNLVDPENANPNDVFFALTDYGYSVGVGYDLIRRIKFELNYIQGLRNIVPDILNTPNFNPDDIKQLNQTISLTTRLFLFYD